MDEQSEKRKYVKPVVKLLEIAGRRVANEELARLLELEAQPNPTSTSNVQGGSVFP